MNTKHVCLHYGHGKNQDQSQNTLNYYAFVGASRVL